MQTAPSGLVWLALMDGLRNQGNVSPLPSPMVFRSFEFEGSCLGGDREKRGEDIVMVCGERKREMFFPSSTEKERASLILQCVCA